MTLDDLPSELAECVDDDVERHASDRVSAPEAAETSDSESAFKPDSLKLDDIAKAHVMYVLAKENGNKAKAARVLGIHRRKLYRLLERFSCNEAEAPLSVVE